MEWGIATCQTARVARPTRPGKNCTLNGHWMLELEELGSNSVAKALMVTALCAEKFDHPGSRSWRCR